MACRPPERSSASDGHPRSPAAPETCRDVGFPNVRPPSRDLAVLISVAAPRAVHRTTISGSDDPVLDPSATRGGISPLRRPSPGTVFTCTAAPNVVPPSRLTATNTSALPLADAPHATATNLPAAA